MPPPLIAIYALGSAGDVLPMIALGRALHTRCNYRIRMITPGKWKDRILEEGLEFFDHHDDPIMCTTDGFETKEIELFVKYRGDPRGVAALMRASASVLEYLYRTVDEHLKDVDLAVLVNVGVGLQDDLQARGIPFVVCNLQPGRATQDYPPPMMSQLYQPDSKQTGYSNIMSWASYGFIAIWNLNPIFQARRRALGYRRGFLPSSVTILYDVLQKLLTDGEALARTPFMCAFSPALLPIPSDFKPTMEHLFSGPLLLGPELCAKPFVPAQDLVDFLATGRIVYFGYGSLQKIGPTSTKEIDHMSIWLAAIQELESQGLELKAIFSFSWGQEDIASAEADSKYQQLREDMDTLIGQKRVFRLLGSYPHTYLFPKCHVAVHHGGAGTTQTAAKYRLPAIIVPHFLDQPFMGSVAKHHGIGTVIDLDDFSTATLVAALKDILLDRPEFYKKNCDRIADEMAKEDPIGGAVQLIQSLLQGNATPESEGGSDDTAA
ncbi:uncharacterized protein BJ171DRAFT_480913 [Polychytrium aggregatum]|uniref:uncharacterized protein n=1 Tax=Polychytrium aggregatum TaxID=110093 RepID=UPI0022FF32FA|nr:uncharacterized protein BJ171DRAFT_480913 [Polychytrium aggregatum]KAI9193060.1 hypothetical protein BJ171DRAFT_480913 [Polychytrium aggregatum]